MLKNYINISWRYLWKQKELLFVNLGGMSLGLTCCMLSFLYTRDEFSFDAFHDKKDRLYRLTYTFFNVDKNESDATYVTSITAGENFQSDIPEIDALVRIAGNGVVVRKGTEVIRENVNFVDGNFFSVFTFPLRQGDAETALRNENSIVISEALALKYFGHAPAIGNELEINLWGKEFETFIVTGVAKNSPENSSIRFDLLLPFDLYKKSRRLRVDDWFGGYLTTFMLLQPQAQRHQIEKKFSYVFDKRAGELFKRLSKEYGVNASITYGLQPIKDIHLSATFGGSNVSKPLYSYVLSALSLFILLIACFNFVNLSIAHSFGRAKEVGIRKISGSHRRQLVTQFFVEAFLVSALAFALSLILTTLTLPIFNELANKNLSFSYLADKYLIGGYVALLIITALLAGSFSAGVLSRLNPVQALYGRLKVRGHGFAKGLVVVQFSLATLLTIATGVILLQSRYLLHYNLGYNDKDLVRIPLAQGEQQADRLAYELLQSSAVRSVTMKNSGFNRTLVKINGKDMTASDFRVDERYLATLNIPLLSGSNFNPKAPNDSSGQVIVNEAFLREADLQGNPVGQTLMLPEHSRHAVTIIGVVKDFNIRSLREKIQPLVLHQLPDYRYGELLVRIDSNHLEETVTFLQKAYQRTDALYPAEIEFVDVTNAQAYDDEMRWAKILTITAALAIVISCTGLFALAALSIQKRTKEIGIRKVLGASVRAIVTMLSRDFIGLVVISALISFPIGYYACNWWLESFAYRIALTWWMLGGAGFLCCTVAIFTVSFQSVKIAIANPVDSLRNE